MGSIRISLFGKFCLRNDEQIVADLGVQKAQELFCYLLLNRRQPQVREKLAVLLWENCSIAKSKRYLRQTLWQLQSTLNEINGKSLLFVEPDWMQVNPETDFWLDVDRFEHAYVLAQGHRGRDLDAVQAEALKEAVHLYRGDLLENCYQDWCLFERERLQNMFLSVLDKLMSYCESQHDYENGILYGMKILRCDYARERTHRQLMRLRFLARDRTGALRQFQLCAKALDNELGVKPSHHTIALYDQLRQAKPNVQLVSLETGVESPVPSPLSSETLDHLNHLKATLASVQQQIESEIEAVKLALNGRW